MLTKRLFKIGLLLVMSLSLYGCLVSPDAAILDYAGNWVNFIDYYLPPTGTSTDSIMDFGLSGNDRRFMLTETKLKLSTNGGETYFDAIGPEGIKTVVYNVGTNWFIAAGEGGKIWISQDGMTWEERKSGTTATINKLDATDGGSLIGVTDNSIIFSSDSGVSWHSYDSIVRSPREQIGPSARAASSNRLYGITSGNGIWVAVGSSGIILTSADSGSSWTQRVSGTDSNLLYVGYANGIFVAVGDTGPSWTTNEKSVILTSSDGVTWTPRSSGTMDALKSVAYGNNTFVAVGANSVILTSSNGITWTTRSSGLGGLNFIPQLNSVIFDASANIFHAVGQGGAYLRSPDGVTWTDKRGGNYNKMQGIAYGNSTFVSVGDMGTIITSPDGTTWTTRTSGTTNWLGGITYGNGMFVAVGSAGTILTSSDGVTWTKTASGASGLLYKVAFGNGAFVAVEYYGKIFTSTNGTTWTQRTSGITNDALFGITYGNGTFVAVSYSGKIITSVDGITWTQRSSGGSYFFYDVTFGNGLFMAVGENGAIITSPDGIAWTSGSSGVTTALYGATYGNEVFIVVGATGKVLLSFDGLTWKNGGSVSTNSLFSVTAGNSRFVGVGEWGTIIPSEQICTAILTSDFKMGIPVVNFNGAYYWAALQYAPGTTSDIMFKLTNAGSITDPAVFGSCQASTLSESGGVYKLQMPGIKFNSSYYWVNLDSVPTTDGQVWFRLSAAGVK